MTVDRMIKASQIEITRAEGKNTDDMATYVFPTWAEANDRLKGIAATVDHKGSDDVDFRVAFEDGQSYNGTIEIKANGEVNESLQDHIRNHLSFHLGMNRPSHLSEEEYQRIVRTYEEATPSVIEYMQRIASTYRIG